MEDGFGTYIKISKIPIKEKSIINIGDSYLAFSYNINLNNNNNNKSRKFLFLKIINKDREYEPIILGKDKNEYTIGRTKISDITIDDIHLSKINCCLNYEKYSWYIQDGNRNGNPSTNGTWLYSSEDYEIFDGMIFKSNKYNFCCNLSKIF